MAPMSDAVFNRTPMWRIAASLLSGIDIPLLLGMLALGLKPYLAREHQGPVIVTIHQPADPRFDLLQFVEALKRRGVLISNFYNTAAPTMRIGAIGAITPDDMRRAVGAIGAALDDVLPKAA